MPFYEYVCRACGAESEILQKLSDPPETECPHCHAQALVKQISAAGFRLKGGGWYETDFKSGDKRNLTGNETGEAPKADGDKPADGAKPAEAGTSKAPEPAAAPSPSTDNAPKKADKTPPSTTAA
jgi:putative FmdB family regulatory protein